MHGVATEAFKGIGCRTWPLDAGMGVVRIVNFAANQIVLRAFGNLCRVAVAGYAKRIGRSLLDRRGLVPFLAIHQNIMYSVVDCAGMAALARNRHLGMVAGQKFRLR